MKPIRVFTSSGIMMLVGGAFFALLFVNALIGTIDALIRGDTDALGGAAIGMAIFAAFTALFVFSANRLMCSVRREDDRICRVGLFGGFYKEINVADIRQVVIRRMWRECDFICLMDGNTGNFDRARKDSFICFPHNEANVAFLREFWDGDINEMKDAGYV